MTPESIISDPALPACIREKMASIQSERIARNCIASDGSSWKTQSEATFRTNLLKWHDAGKPENFEKWVAEFGVSQ